MHTTQPDLNQDTTLGDVCDGMSLGEIARRSGLSKSHVSLVFRGLRQPSLDTCYRLADGLGVSVPDIIRLLPQSDRTRVLGLNFPQTPQTPQAPQPAA